MEHALGAFARHGAIDGILPVIREGDRGYFDRCAASRNALVMDPVYGGETRQASVHAGLRALSEHCPRHVLIHDAARPFPSRALLGRVIQRLEEADGAIPALPVADTLKRSDNGRVAATVDRAGLWTAQTPQGFHFEKILRAHEAAVESSGAAFTDDASIAEWHGMEVALVDGEITNIKLTNPEDFMLAEQIAAGGEYRTGCGYDVHALEPGDQVTLCGVAIPHDKTLAGHSDADVGLHALTDAVLGTIGDGDIGSHFPPDEAQWKDAPSDVFLRHAAARVRKLGGSIVNVDVTLVCETPKIGPHRAAMRERVAAILEIPIERVSVKATTTEGLGFTGRGEGIAANATATVRMMAGGGARER